MSPIDLIRGREMHGISTRLEFIADAQVGMGDKVDKLVVLHENWCTLIEIFVNTVDFPVPVGPIKLVMMW